jgi:hypothetical protein
MKDVSCEKTQYLTPLEDTGEEDKDKEENRDEDADPGVDKDSDEEDKEDHGGASGEQGEGVSPEKGDEDADVIVQQPQTVSRKRSSACSIPLLERIRDVSLGTILRWQACAVCVCVVDMRIESILVEYLRNFEWFGRGLH